MGHANMHSNKGRRSRAGLIRWVYVMCMLAASLNHFGDILRGGMLPYRFAPVFLNVYWTALAVIDLAAVALLFLRPRLGVALTAAVIFTNIPINAYATVTVFDSRLFAHWETQSQLVFGVFVLATMTYVMKYFRRTREAKSFADPRSDTSTNPKEACHG